MMPREEPWTLVDWILIPSFAIVFGSVGALALALIYFSVRF